MKKFALAMGGFVLMCACGGGGGVGGGGGGTPPPPALSVIVFPSSQTNVDPGQAVKFTATVDNDSSAKGVTWSVSATGLTGTACGSFTNMTTTAATFNAPSSVSA